jgi:hypothetical protein
MNNQPHIPDPETSKRLLANLRRSRLAIEAATLELEDITAQLENYSRHQRLNRVRNSLSLLTGQSPDVISTNAEIPS